MYAYAGMGGRLDNLNMLGGRLDNLNMLGGRLDI
jgi:hypothetical protein